jgi:hypothetical protein
MFGNKSVFVAKVQCGCWKHVRIRVEGGNEGEASCWYCPFGRVKVVRHGGSVKGYRMGYGEYTWQDTTAFMDADESNLHKPQRKKGMARW